MTSRSPGSLQAARCAVRAAVKNGRRSLIRLRHPTGRSHRQPRHRHRLRVRRTPCLSPNPCSGSTSLRPVSRTASRSGVAACFCFLPGQGPLPYSPGLPGALTDGVRTSCGSGRPASGPTPYWGWAGRRSKLTLARYPLPPDPLPPAVVPTGRHERPSWLSSTSASCGPLVPAS